jgi:hypothetical protein
MLSRNLTPRADGSVLIYPFSHDGRADRRARANVLSTPKQWLFWICGSQTLAIQAIESDPAAVPRLPKASAWSTPSNVHFQCNARAFQNRTKDVLHPKWIQIDSSAFESPSTIPLTSSGLWKGCRHMFTRTPRHGHCSGRRCGAISQPPSV